MTVVPHRMAPCDDENSHKRQYIEFYGDRGPGSRGPRVITDDWTRLVRQYGKRRNRQNAAIFDMPLSFRTTSVQHCSKRGQNRKELNAVPSCYDFSILSMHTRLEVDPASLMLLICNQVDAIVRAGKDDQISQLSRPRRKRVGCRFPSMSPMRCW